jgi:long-chain acyl-CoA synthetase
VNQDRVDFGAGLMNVYDLYISKKTPTWFLGIFSVNRYEWVVSDLGAGCYSIPNVSLYDTLGPETSEFIINHSELPIIVTSVDKVANLLSLSSKCPDLKVIIVMENLLKQAESPIPILQKWGAQLGVTILTFSQILQLGKKNPRPHQPPQPDDVCLISYTSGTPLPSINFFITLTLFKGTTGNPKGAMLSHTNIISTLRAGSLSLPLDSSDIHISYLPLAHIFERVLLSNTLFIGGSAGFFRGDVALLIEDLGVLRPTLFASVPRLFNRIYDKIVQGALNSGSAVKAALFTKALDSKLYHLNHGGHLTHSVWDPLVFSKVKAVLGGRVRLMISGSAPISSTVMNFLRVATGAQMIEGYGQTESCAGLTLSWKDDFLPGHVGSVQAK